MRRQRVAANPYTIYFSGIKAVRYVHPIYSAFSNLILVEDEDCMDYKYIRWNAEKREFTGNSIYISEINGLTTEFRRGAEYGYDRCIHYSLAIGCEGRDWHDVLAQMVGFDPAGKTEPSEDTPFREILHPELWSATFGPLAAKKLLKDFDAWEERAKTFADAEFYLAYWYLRCCFGHAANGGAVQMNWVDV